MMTFETNKLEPTLLPSLQVSRHQIGAWGSTPNTSVQGKPLMIYWSAFPRNGEKTKPSASAVEAHLRSVGVVEPQWRYTMYSTSHFHSTSHEVLVVVAGRARCCFGGEENPERVEVEIQQGDAVVIPAGVSHRLIHDPDGRFQMVGSYPRGFNWDMCYGKPGEEDKVESIKSLKWFKRDPIYGDTGPALES